MTPSVGRILDANFNRAREALRVLEEHARFVLDDKPLTTSAKQIRHDLANAAGSFGLGTLLVARDTPNDVGTEISTSTENLRIDTTAVAVAAGKRAAEAMRCIEEYGKIAKSQAAAKVEQLRYRLYALEQELLIGGPRRAKLRAARLHVLVTESLCKGDWLLVTGGALAGGADVIQLREKELTDTELLERAKRLRELTARHGAMLIINDRPDIARICDADGVHLGQDDLPVSSARSVVGANFLIGKSTHSIDEARAALAEGADYIGVGTMFASPTKPNVPVRGAKLLAEVAALAEVPLVAIGGIHSGNASQIRMAIAGQKRDVILQVAVSQAIIGADDPAKAARKIKAALGESRKTEI